MELKEYKELLKNINNYYEFNGAVQNGILEELQIPAELVDNRDIDFSKYSELKAYLESENIPEQNVLYIKDSDIDNIVLVKHNNGALELLEEIWDSEETLNGVKYYWLPYLNSLNNVDLKINENEIKTLTKKELIETIKNNLGYFNEWLDNGVEDLYNFYESLSGKLDKWNIPYKENDFNLEQVAEELGINE